MDSTCAVTKVTDCLNVNFLLIIFSPLMILKTLFFISPMCMSHQGRWSIHTPSAFTEGTETSSVDSSSVIDILGKLQKIQIWELFFRFVAILDEDIF